jgi:hypothetical protein
MKSTVDRSDSEVATLQQIMKTKLHSTFTLLFAAAVLLPSCNAKYDISHDKRTESWADFVSGC